MMRGLRPCRPAKIRTRRSATAQTVGTHFPASGRQGYFPDHGHPSLLRSNVSANIRVVSRLSSADGYTQIGGYTIISKIDSLVIARGQLGGTWAHEIGHGVGITGDYDTGGIRDRIMWHIVEGAQTILELNSECEAYEKQ